MSKSVRHFVCSAKELCLNLTITQTGYLYGLCLGPSLFSRIISYTILIDPLMSLFTWLEFFNNITLHPTFNTINFGIFHSFIQWFAPLNNIFAKYWGTIFTTGEPNMFRYLIVGSIPCFHYVTRLMASSKMLFFI